MLISRLHNDVLSKKHFWKQFSIDNDSEFKHFVTKSRDADRLELKYNHNNINVVFNESDGKPLSCVFDIKVNRKITLEISQITIFNRIFNIFWKKEKPKHLFLKKYKIKSNKRSILDTLKANEKLLDLMRNDIFFGLYAYTQKNTLKVRVTSTFFVSSYDELKRIYLIVNSLIDDIMLSNEQV